MIRARLAPHADVGRLAVEIRTDHEGTSELIWETLSGDPPPLPDRLDPVAIALIAKAMNFTQDLHLEGLVSWSLLAGLEEFVDAWTSWRPDLFRPVRITADEVVDDRAADPSATPAEGGRAVAAFSGGVDGTYATVAHRTGLLGRRSLDLRASVLVHGFDIPLDDQAGFQVAARGAQAITAEIGVPLVTMRTNWQEVANPDWQMTFSSALAAVLHLFTDRADAIVIAADNTYRHIAVPWGSNPISTPLLASRRMRVQYPGGAVTRTQKCAVIGRYESVRAHLRVCWAGDDLGRNCGRCEKCVRTKVNFLATPHGTIPALGPLEPGQLRAQTIGSAGAMGIYQEMRDDLDRLPTDVAADLAWLLDQGITEPTA